jgi:hypothetical protein
MVSSITLTETIQPAGGQAMRIDGATGSQTSLGFNPANATAVGTPDTAASGQTTTAGQFQAGSDFLQLMAALGRIPQVRQDVVGDVASRLGGDDLSSPEAGQETVESILGSSPGHD